MRSEQIKHAREACKQQLLDTLMTLTRENGTDYDDYYECNEHGIYDDEYTIVKVFSIYRLGCHIALPLQLRNGIEDDTDPTPETLADEFSYHSYLSLYIERDQTGYETLMLYQSVNAGVCLNSELAEPDHLPASEMSLAELDYLTQAIYWYLHKAEEEATRLPEVTEPQEMDFFSVEPDGNGGKQIHIWGYCFECDDNGKDWRNLEYTGFIEPLQEFIKHLKENEDYVSEASIGLNQYIGDHDDNGMVDIINHYFNGHTANAELTYSDVTMSTPCGDYVQTIIRKI